MRPSVSEHVHLHFYVLSLPFSKDANGNNKAIQILADQQGNGKAPRFDSFAYAPCVRSEECMKKRMRKKERGSSSKPCSQFGLCLLLKLQWSSHAAAINIVCILNLVNLTTFTWERWVKERGWRCSTKRRRRKTNSIGHLKQTDVSRVSLFSRRYLFAATSREALNAIGCTPFKRFLFCFVFIQIKTQCQLGSEQQTGKHAILHTLPNSNHWQESYWCVIKSTHGVHSQEIKVEKREFKYNSLLML